MLRRPRSRRSPCGVDRHGPPHRRAALHPHDLGAHVGEHHRGERAGPDAGEFEDPVTAQWTGHVSSPPRPDDPRSSGRCRRSHRRAPATAGGAGRGPCRTTYSSRAPGNQLGRAEPTLRRDQGVVASVDHQGRHVETGEGVRPVAAGVDRRKLTLGPLRRERAVEAVGRQGPDLFLVVVLLRLPHLRPHRRFDEGATFHGRRREQGVTGLRRRGADPGVAGAAHDRGEAGDAVGVLDRHGLHDHPAHRHAGDVGPIDAEVVEHADPVGGHVGQRVGDLGHRFPGELRLQHLHRVGALPVQLRRQPAVAVVVPDDVQALVDQLLEQVAVPTDHL